MGISDRVINDEKKRLAAGQSGSLATKLTVSFWTLAAVGAAGCGAFIFNAYGWERLNSTPAYAQIDPQTTATISKGDFGGSGFDRKMIDLQSESASLRTRIVQLESLVEVLSKKGQPQDPINFDETTASVGTAPKTQVITNSDDLDRQKKEQIALANAEKAKPVLILPDSETVITNSDNVEVRNVRPIRSEPKPVATLPVTAGTSSQVTNSTGTEANSNVSPVVVSTRKQDEEAWSNNIGAGSANGGSKAQFAINFGRKDSEEAARTQWEEMLDKRRNLIANLKPVYVESSPGQSPGVQLLAGPFADAANAISTCVRLRSIGYDCKTSLMKK